MSTILKLREILHDPPDRYTYPLQRIAEIKAIIDANPAPEAIAYARDHLAAWDGDFFQRVGVDILSPSIAIHAPLCWQGDVAALAASPCLVHVTSLRLGMYSGHNLKKADLEALASSPHLKNLTHLNLRECWIYAGDMQRILGFGLFKNLTHLNLSRNPLFPGGAAALAASPSIKNLTHLDLSDNRIGAIGAAAITSSPHLNNLTHLNLSETQALTGKGDPGVFRMLKKWSLPCLTHLELRRNRLGNGAAAAIAASPHLSNLTYLDLRDNRIGEAGEAAMAASPYLKNCKIEL